MAVTLPVGAIMARGRSARSAQPAADLRARRTRTSWWSILYLGLFGPLAAAGLWGDVRDHRPAWVLGCVAAYIATHVTACSPTESEGLGTKTMTETEDTARRRRGGANASSSTGEASGND